MPISKQSRVIIFILGISAFFSPSESTAHELYGEKVTLQRADESTLSFYLNEPKGNGPYSILLYLQGSSCDSLQKDATTANILKNFKAFGQVVSEKYGISDRDQECPKEYLENNTLFQRVEDYRQVFEFLRKFDSRWDHKLYIVGVSEGAIIGPQVSQEIPETMALSIVAGSGSSSVAEHFVLIKTKQMEAEQRSEAQMKQELSILNEKFNEIYANPTPDLSWQTPTDTYYYWSGVLGYRSSDFLKRWKIPLFIVHGTEDEELAIEPTRSLVSQFRSEGRKNIFYHEYKGLNHFWDDKTGRNHYEEILNFTISEMLTTKSIFYSSRTSYCPMGETNGIIR